MLCSDTVLQWPYGEYDSMIPESTMNLEGLANFDASLLKTSRQATVERKPRPQVHELQGRSLRGNYISNTDRNKGQLAETLFAESMEALGHTVYVLPHFSHNYKMHVDFEVETTHGVFWVDVKSAKSLRKTMSKTDPFNRPQNKYVCLELNSSGSLFGSHSDFIAFGLTDNSFILVDRLKLVDIVTAKMDFKTRPQERSAWPETALWQPYVRSYNGVNLVMTYMDLDDLRDSIVCHLSNGHSGSTSTATPGATTATQTATTAAALTATTTATTA